MKLKFLMFLLLPLLAGCEGGRKVADAPARAPEDIEVRYTVAVGGREVQMQLAVRPGELQRGLMGRAGLQPDEGMLFLFARPQRMSFWMRNTPLPLDIGYFDQEGVLREVYPLFPYNETPVVSVAEDLRFALEMRQGWFREHGVRPGARIDLEAVAAGLRARGFDPAVYGIR